MCEELLRVRSLGILKSRHDIDVDSVKLTGLGVPLTDNHQWEAFKMISHSRCLRPMQRCREEGGEGGEGGELTGCDHDFTNGVP